MTAVEAILFPEGKSSSLSVYDSLHIRKIDRQNLSIPFADFCERVAVREKGALTITFAGSSGFVQDGFALRSDNYMYYGTVTDGIIKELCLQRFDQADDEFCNLAANYELVLVVWCNGQITSA